MTTARLALAAAAATGVQVGAAIVATRLVVDQTGPGSLAFLRYLIGVLFLLPAATMAARVRFARRDVVPIALLGIGQFGVLIALLNYALQHIPSARAALIFATFPLITMVLAAVLGRERLTLLKTVGVALTIVGVGVSLGETALLSGGADHGWLGTAAAFASALTGAVCAVLYRPYLARYPTVQVSAFAMAASVAFLALLAGGEGLFAAWPAFTGTGWGAIAFIGASSGIGYWLWLFALRHAPPTQVTVFLGLSPVTAAILGALVLDEPITAGTVIGLGFVLLGLWLALWRRTGQTAPIIETSR